MLREADTLAKLGFEPRILAVVSTEVRARRASVGGVPILRLAPTSPLAWIRSRLARFGRSSDAPASAGEEALPDPEAPADRTRGALGTGMVRIHRWFRTIDFYRQAIRVVRTTRPALVHCNDYNTMWIGVAARVLTGAAVVYDAHELWPDRNLRPEPRWWLLACESLFVRCAHRTVTASPGYAEVIARRYRVAPPTVVRNIPAQPPAEGEPSTENGTVAAYVGALTRNRGLEISIRALSRVPGARLRLLGPVNPAYRTELTELAEREGVSERVELGSPVPPSEVVESMRTASVGLALIQPICLSYEMSLPNKLFEYLLAGVPVLGSDLPVIGAFVRENQVGLVAQPDDVDDVAAKLREMLRPERNEALRRGVRRAAGELRWERESRLLADTYMEAVARAGRQRRPG